MFVRFNRKENVLPFVINEQGGYVRGSDIRTFEAGEILQIDIIRVDDCAEDGCSTLCTKYEWYEVPADSFEVVELAAISETKIKNETIMVLERVIHELGLCRPGKSHQQDKADIFGARHLASQLLESLK